MGRDEDKFLAWEYGGGRKGRGERDGVRRSWGIGMGEGDKNGKGEV